jgi:hypothetical protein
VDGVALAPLPFAPKAYAITGSLKWTLYSGSNFDGNSTCLAPDYSILVTYGYISEVVGSVIKGCNLEVPMWCFELWKIKLNET